MRPVTMLSQKKYNRIFKQGSYSNYVIRRFKYVMKDVCHKVCNTPKSIYLCVRFPFLYPRNVMTNRRYNNWKLSKKYNDIFRKWSEYSKDHVDLYKEKFGDDCLFLDRKYVKTEYILKLATKKDKFLYWFYKKLERFLGLFHIIPTYSLYDCIPYGWRKRFGVQLCRELKEALKKNPDKSYRKSFRIMDIKEKWGVLNIYCNSYSPEVSRVIRKYEYLSKFVCIDCGEDATKKTLGWVSPYCNRCLEKNHENERWIYIDPIYGWENSEHKKYNEEVLKELP